MLRSLVRLNGRPDWRVGIRVAVAMFVPVAVGAEVGEFNDGLFVGIGGMLVAACDTGGPYARRARVLALTAVGVALAIALGSLAGEPTWLATVVVFVAVSALGLLAVYGQSGAITGFMVSIALVVGVGLGGDADAALRLGLEVLAGGGWAVVLSLLGWGLHRDRPERQAVATAYRAVAAFARAAAAAEPDAPLAPEQRSGAITALTAARQSVGGAPAADRDRLDAELRAAGGLFDGVLGLAQFRQAGPAELRRPPVAPALDAAFAALADLMAGLGDAVDGKAPPADPLGPLARADAGLRSAAGDHQALLTAWSVARDAARTAATVVAPGDDVVELPAAPPAPPARGGALSVLRSQLNWNSMVLRNSLRVGAVAAIGIVLSRIIDPDHGTWMTTAAIIVLKPDFGGTLNYAIGRAAGTVVGAALAGVLVAAVTDRTAIVILAALFTIGAMSVLKVNYALFMVLVTPLAVLLVAIGDPGNWKFADERVLDTLIGVLLALVAGYLLWPNWERRRLPDQLSATVDADRAYLTAVLASAAGDGREGIGAARATAERENANAAASLQRLRGEPARGRGDPAPVDELAGHAQRLVDAGTSLAGAPSDLPDLRAEVGAFAASADRALAALADAAGRSAAPAALPPLDERLPAANGDPRRMLVRRELEEVALDIDGMHAALGRLATPA